MPKISSYSTKGTPVDADKLLASDSASADATVNVAASDLKSYVLTSPTVTGDMTVDTNTLHVDSSNNRVGIGTTSPNFQLHIDLATAGTANYIQMTNLDTGNAAGDGFVFGISATEDVILNQRENAAMAFYTNDSEKMRIDPTGDILIGKTTNEFSTAGFNIQTGGNFGATRDNGQVAVLDRLTTDGQIAVFRKDNVEVGSVLSHSGGGISVDSAETLRFLTNGGAEAGRFDTGGNFLVGKTATSSTLVGAAIRDDGDAFFTRSGDNVMLLNRLASDGDLMRFQQDNTVHGSISISGSTTSYNTTSDYRLKENVVDLTGATSRLKQIPVHRFNFISAPEKTVDGFIAHEVQSIVPEAVTGSKDAMKTVVIQEAVEAVEAAPATYWTEEDELPEGVLVGDLRTPAVEAVEAVEEITETVPDYQGIDQAKLVPLLVATIQELEARITALEA